MNSRDTIHSWSTSGRLPVATVIVGYGHAGRDLHEQCIQKLWASRPGSLSTTVDILAVDLSSDRRNLAEKDGHRATDVLPPVNLQHPTVCHICIPPKDRAAAVRAVLDRGYRSILVEKPAALSEHEYHQLLSLEEQFGARILVVSNWPCSALTACIRAFLRSKELGDAISAVLVQTKSRIARSQKNVDEHIAEVELPHQLALALHLLGDGHVEECRIADMILPNGSRIASMGSARVVLRHSGNVHSTVFSSLAHPVRQRSISIEMSTGVTIEGWFPASADDNISSLQLRKGSELLFATSMFDDPLTRSIELAYNHFHPELGPSDESLVRAMSLPAHKKIASVIEFAMTRKSVEQIGSFEYLDSNVSNGGPHASAIL